MNNAYTYSSPKYNVRWTAAIFMPLITLIGVIGTPIYIYFNGLAWDLKRTPEEKINVAVAA